METKADISRFKTCVEDVFLIIFTMHAEDGLYMSMVSGSDARRDEKQLNTDNNRNQKFNRDLQKGLKFLTEICYFSCFEIC